MHVGIFDVCFQVVVLVNDGTREFFTKVSPRQGLCDGKWHRITGENFLINTQKPLKDSLLLKSLASLKIAQGL